MGDIPKFVSMCRLDYSQKFQKFSSVHSTYKQAMSSTICCEINLAETLNVTTNVSLSKLNIKLQKINKMIYMYDYFSYHIDNGQFEFRKAYKRFHPTKVAFDTKRTVLH